MLPTDDRIIRSIPDILEQNMISKKAVVIRPQAYTTSN